MMKERGLSFLSRWVVSTFCGCIVSLSAQTSLRFDSIRSLPDRDARILVSAPAGMRYRIDTATNLPAWSPLLTWQSAGADAHTDSAAPYLGSRYYRAVEVTGTNVLTGDHLGTTNGDLILHPVNHAGLVMRWNGLWLYADPVGGSFAGIPKADLVLLSHGHSDHFNLTVLAAVAKSNSVFIAPRPVYDSLGSFRNVTLVLTNGASTNVLGLTVAAIRAYNSYHPLGTGNGYVITLGGRRVYVSGDTGSIAEMRALADIDVAFVCMNVPYTMTVNEAADAVRAFRPRVVYPYHFRNQDNTQANLALFRQLVGTDLGIEVRLRKWY